MKRGLVVLVAVLAVRLGVPAWYGRMANDDDLQRGLSAELVRFETNESAKPAKDRFSGEWAMVTHQMAALGLAQAVLAHPELNSAYGPTLRKAAS